MMGHPLALTASILDPVHGLIRLTKQERKVINSPVFRRLRRIKQNGLLHYVFPAASHTRFEHSLGVLYVVESMLQALFSNSLVAAEKSELLDESGAAFDISRLEPDELTRLFQLARLAALCHDLGHGPLSHTFEKFAPAQSKVVQLLLTSDVPAYQVLAKAIQQKAQEATEEGGDKRISHEWMSCILCVALFQEVDSDQQDGTGLALAVAAALQNDSSLVEDTRTKRLIGLVHDLIASAPADADRMDYVERDSRSCGVTYGLFDRSRLLKSFLCYKNDAGELRLGIKSSGFRAVENFVQARFQLFVQVYYHKTNRAVELMLGKLGKLASQASEHPSIVDDGSLEALLKSYAHIGDDDFLEELASKVANTEINRLAQDILNRNLWKRVTDFREALIPPAEESEFLEELSKRCGATSMNLCRDQVYPAATKDLEHGAALLFRDEQGVYRRTESQDWTKISHLIAALHTEEKSVVRVYYADSDERAAKACRKESLTLEAQYRAKKGNDHAP